MCSVRWFGCLVLASVLVSAGCSDSVRLAEVQGTVTVNGKPVDKIQVEFWPIDKGPRSIGVTDSDGRFTLTTDDGKRTGASVGSHKIVLKDVGIMGDKFLGRAGEDVDMTQGKKPRIANLYGDVQTTTLERQVTSGKITIELEAKGP